MELKISNLSKTYANGVKAVNKVSIEIGSGMFGLLGPNGAGKSSLMKILATLVSPDEGEATLNGLDILTHKTELKKQLGYLPQEFGVFPKISAYDLLHHIAILKGINKDTKAIVNNMLLSVNLYEVRKKNVSDFSGGMRQRFGIAQALISEPNLLIVDEPTAGLDPTERNRFHNILAKIAEDKIVILSTHIVQDVIELCNDMAIMDKGQIKYKGSPNNALDILKGKVYGSFIEDNKLKEVSESHKILSQKLLGGKTYINVFSEDKAVAGFEKKEANLEDVFFYLTNQQ